MDGPYFVASCDHVYELAVIVAQLVARKVSPTRLAIADLGLYNVSYTLPQEGRYALVAHAPDAAMAKVGRYSSDAARLILVVNRAIGHKWGGDPGKAIDLMRGIDRDGASARDAHRRLA